jgi:hypothetical protein
MKRLGSLCLLLACGITLASCSKGGEVVSSSDEIKSSSADTSESSISSNTLRTKNITMKYLNNEEVSDYGNFDILFKDNSDIPYISLSDGVNILSSVRHKRIDENRGTNNGFSILSENSEEAVITNDNLGICTLNIKNQTIKFDDFDVFSNIYFADQSPLMIADISPELQSLKATKIEYSKGNAVTLDLNNYSKLDIIKNNNKFYMPVALFSSVFLSSFNGNYIGYNFDNLYLVEQGGLSTTDLEEKKVLSTLGASYYGGVKKENVSAEYAAYTTQCICFDMDYFYGLKNDKNINSFYSFLEKKGYLTDMLSGNVKKMDAALLYAIYDLNDGHTFFSDFSPLYKFGEESFDKTKLNAQKLASEKSFDDFKNAKIKANVEDDNVIDEANQTMYITFSSFTAINEKIIYSGNKHNDFVYALCTAAQFSDAYKTLVEKKDVIKNVVVDLTTNDGGASDGMLYALSVLIGEVSFDIYDPLSHGHTRATYKADMNLDKKIDENDVSLADLGFNIIFLTSEYTFSSANAMVVQAKASRPSVMTIGQTTGGGPCVVKHSCTGIGSVYSSSGLNVISLKDGNNYVNIDKGQKPDHDIEKDKLLDRSYIIAKLKEWLKK